MQVSNWDKWQTYRKDRGTPPWIKVHRNLMSNPEWVTLSDSEKGQLVSLWLVAADKDGKLPDSPSVLQKMCMLESEPNVNKFIELGFLLPSGDQVVTSRLPSGDQVDDRTTTENEDVSSDGLQANENVCGYQVVTTCPQHDAPETETETETEERRESKFAQAMYSKILESYPSTKKPNFKTWENDIRLAVERDNRDIDCLWKVFLWANADDFWTANILSPKKLREKYDQLEAQRIRGEGKVAPLKEQFKGAI